MAAAREGRDPAAEVLAAKAPTVEDDRDRIAALIAQFHKRHLWKLRTGNAVKRDLDRHVVSVWRDRDVKSISRRDVVDLLDRIAEAGHGVTANRVRAYPPLADTGVEYHGQYVMPMTVPADKYDKVPRDIALRWAERLRILA